MMVAADLMRRGYKIAFPYGEDWDYDLIVCRDEDARARAGEVQLLEWAT